MIGAAGTSSSSCSLEGTGRDDVTDVLDRRVEFSPMACNEAVRADAAVVQQRNAAVHLGIVAG